MRRSMALLFLLLSLVWQSVSMAGGRLLPELAQDADHAALHWQERAHHHHDDGSYDSHEDDDEAAAHVHFDAASGGAALTGPTVFGLAPLDAAAPSFRYVVILPSPPPSGLRRPPRLTA